MERTYIKDIKNKIGETVHLAGWVNVRRDHGKLIFIDLRDGSGTVQMVVLPQYEEAQKAAHHVRSQWVIEVEGIVNKRPEKQINPDEENGELEVEITKAAVLSEAAELPFDPETDLNIDTYLNHLPLTLRTQKGRDIFTLQARIVQAYRNALIKRNFMEFQAPALTGEDAEGGAAAFKVNYYHDRTAYLATSPQLYKEIMVGPFERVFTVAKIFRGEKHATTRHLSEITQMDFEMGFIKDHNDVMDMLEAVIRDTVAEVSEHSQNIFKRFDVEAPALSKEVFPRLTLKEAQEILKKEYGIDAMGEDDLEPEHERKICEWAKKTHGSDFVFVTEFPTHKRAFYSYPVPENPELSRSFDLLFRGLEINSGSQRFHNYEEIVEVLKSRNLDPEKFDFYLQTHKYGIPPHGGCSTGLERFTARMLELSNVKLASAFPRDMTRIDKQLSDE